MKFEKESVTQRDIWFSSNKKDSYDAEGPVTVKMKVKDDRNLWSEEASVSFTVAPAEIVTEDETLDVEVQSSYTVPPKDETEEDPSQGGVLAVPASVEVFEQEQEVVKPATTTRSKSRTKK